MSNRDKIIIVEDSDEEILLYQLYIKANFDVEICIFNTVEEVYNNLDFSKESVREEFKDLALIILDYFLPDGNGHDLLIWLKGFSELQDIPIIMASSYQSEDIVVIAFNSGIHDFIRKPFSISEFVTRVKSAIRYKAEITLRKQKELELEKANIQLLSDMKVLEALNMTDSLTGVYNRRYFDIHIKNEFNRCLESESGTFSLLILDIDHFKQYNDSYGHLQGDYCLNKVAQAIKKTLYQSEFTVFRYGGEEFAIIISYANEATTIKYADIVRYKILSLCIEHNKSITNQFVTVSIGGFVFKKGLATTVEEIIEKADKCLYRAKTAGRNQCVVQ